MTYPSLSPTDPGQPIVFGDGFPRLDGRARFTPADLIAPDDVPDADYPMILTTGRQLEHWHTGSMTRRSKVLDTVEPEANCSLHPSTLRKLGVAPGGLVRLTTKRGSIEIMAREDRAVAPDMVFLPFAFVEAAANLLTNSAVDPFGKIPEFKFSAVKVENARIKSPPNSAHQTDMRNLSLSAKAMRNKRNGLRIAAQALKKCSTCGAARMALRVSGST